MGQEGGLRAAQAVLSLASLRSMWSPPLPAWGNQEKTEKWRNSDVCYQGRGGGGGHSSAGGVSSFNPHSRLLNSEDMYSEVGTRRPAFRLTPTLGAQPPSLSVPCHQSEKYEKLSLGARI